MINKNLVNEPNINEKDFFRKNHALINFGHLKSFKAELLYVIDPINFLDSKG